jgi:hypothetical protein
MIFFFFLILYLFLFFQVSMEPYSIFAILITIYYLRLFFLKLNSTLAFREFVLLIYSFNYLFSPAIVYFLQDSNYVYRMKISESDFFILTIPSVFLLHFGMFFKPTNLFRISLKDIGIISFLNQRLLIGWIIFGISFSFFGKYLPSSLTFLAYLLSMSRYIAGFLLFFIDKRKYRYLILLLIFFDLIIALSSAMFGDLFLWISFSYIFWCFIDKPSLKSKILHFVFFFIILIVIQTIKSDYRIKIWSESEKSNFLFINESFSEQFNSNFYLTNNQILYNLTRLNQGWIFASTVANMNLSEKFQGFALVNLYIESAFLPRFISPHKIKSGDQVIFNEFSGHRINPGTSMGLGMFADGYIAFKHLGVYFFAFALGLIFFSIFKILEHWTKISPFFVMFLFPIFFYAIRPDCDTQTLFGHIVKSLLIIGFIVRYFSKNFNRQITILS